MDELVGWGNGLVLDSVDLGGVFRHAVLGRGDVEVLAHSSLVALLRVAAMGEEPLMVKPVGCGDALCLWTPSSFLTLLEACRRDEFAEAGEPGLLDEYPPVLVCGSLAAAKTAEIGDVGWLLVLGDQRVFVSSGQVARIARTHHDRVACGCTDDRGFRLNFGLAGEPAVD